MWAKRKNRMLLKILKITINAQKYWNVFDRKLKFIDSSEWRLLPPRRLILYTGKLFEGVQKWNDHGSGEAFVCHLSIFSVDDGRSNIIRSFQNMIRETGWVGMMMGWGRCDIPEWPCWSVVRHYLMKVSVSAQRSCIFRNCWKLCGICEQA